MNQTILNLAAMCDKAGRPMNQDNYFVCQDLSDNMFSAVNNDDRDVILSEKGSLAVVADGMGGMNAGEVASKIVIETIKSSFSYISSDIAKDERKIKSFIIQAIISADREVKRYADEHPEASGMGSTVVVLWLLNNKAYVGWCGDSRAYCYNPQNRLVRLTHDHSYVQDLVDQNKISEIDAFYHPDSNIITRSLGDSGQRANPDVEVYPIHKDDIFLLCSDGLCGLLRDDEIQSIIGSNSKSMKGCLMELWNQGTRTGWSDNATIELVRIKDCNNTASNSAIGWAENHQNDVLKPLSQPKISNNSSKSMKDFWLYVSIAALVIGLILGFFIGRARNMIGQNIVNDDQISFLQQEITKLNNQNDSLQNVITSLGQRIQISNSAKHSSTTQTERSGAKPKESLNKRPQVQNESPKEQRRPAHSDITETPTQGQEDFSKLDPNFIYQIQRTISDFENFNNRINECFRIGRITIQEYQEMGQRLADIKSNISTIKANDSYRYVPVEFQRSINNIEKNIPGLQKKLAELRSMPQQAIFSEQGNTNGDEL